MPNTPGLVMDYSYVRYLDSKVSVDDRALHRGVLDRLATSLRRRGDGPLRVVEIGAGVGTMLPRLTRWSVLPSCEYTLVDRDATSLAAAKQHLCDWGSVASAETNAVTLDVQGCVHRVSFEHDNALEYLSRRARGRFDLVIANAVLDLMHLETALPAIWAGLEPGALFWFSINFDGETIFLPELPLDEAIVTAYHRTMDERTIDGRPCGDSHTGRHLLELVPESGATLEAAGASDWVVFPKSGQYEGDEAYFLHHIVHTISTALEGDPEVAGPGLRDWIAERHLQIDQGRLCYVAHQLDLLGRSPSE